MTETFLTMDYVKPEVLGLDSSRSDQAGCYIDCPGDHICTTSSDEICGGNDEIPYQRFVATSTNPVTLIAGNTYTNPNYYDGNGAAGEVQQDGTLTAIGTAGNEIAFVGNTASGKGGAIYIAGKATFQNVSFANNLSIDNGGALHIRDSEESILIQKVDFNQNSAMNGGAIRASSCSVTMENVSFDGNTASYEGGALRVAEAEVSISHGTFSNNHAQDAGGGISISSGTVFLTDVTFVNNGANRDGGGAIINHVSTATVTLAGSVLLATSSDTIYNCGTLNWDISGENAGYLNNFSLLENHGTLSIKVDQDPKTGSYVLAGNAASAYGKAFTLYGIREKDDSGRLPAEGEYDDPFRSEAIEVAQPVENLTGVSLNLTVGGGAVTYGNLGYRLVVENDDLILRAINQKIITITADSAEKVYDGTVLTDSGYTFTQGVLEAGDNLVVTVNGSITDAGTAENVVTSYRVMRGDVDVTANYTFADSVAGTLTVTKRQVTLTSASDTKFYDGTPLTNDTITVSGDGFVTGEGATYTVTGSQTEVGSSLNTFTYTLNAETKAANYNITKTEGTLTVTPVAKIPFFVTGNFAGVGTDYLGKEGDSDSVLHIYQTGAEWGSTAMEENWKFYDSLDFNGDGKADLLRSNETSRVVVGEVSNGNGSFTPQVLNALGDGWQILGTGDFNGNGVGDVLVANPTAASATVGLLGYWEGGTAWNLINGYSAEWEMVSTNDFNGDGKTDMLWKNEFIGEGGKTYNAYCTWIVDNANDWRMVSVANPEEWNFLCTGDFNGDNTADIAMINGEGVVGIWGIQDGYLSSWSILSAVDTTTWNLAGAGDFNGDGTDDIAWCNADTNLAGYWQINNKQLTSWQTIATLA